MTRKRVSKSKTESETWVKTELHVPPDVLPRVQFYFENEWHSDGFVLIQASYSNMVVGKAITLALLNFSATITWRPKP